MRSCGQKHQRLSGFAIVELDPPQRTVKILLGVKTGQDHRLVANQPCCSINAARIAPPGLGVGFGARDEESLGIVNPRQAFEIQIPAIHDIKRARLQHQMIKNVDIVHFPVADEDEGRNAAAHIKQGVEFDRSFG